MLIASTLSRQYGRQLLAPAMFLYRDSSSNKPPTGRVTSTLDTDPSGQRMRSHSRLYSPSSTIYTVALHSSTPNACVPQSSVCSHSSLGMFPSPGLTMIQDRQNQPIMVDSVNPFVSAIVADYMRHHGPIALSVGHFDTCTIRTTRPVATALAVGWFHSTHSCRSLLDVVEPAQKMG